ncbi:LysM peptidoglycan-binding domain-containing protein [Psychrobacter aestuarii]|uniref:LysM domain-containing protein n=1 Tax=Psychrobacter aestuarii TaxID=556327 RepID=A0ABP3FDQ2_9GAMM|nr:LysM domain-containing protein [Psychrobacter aestuarii]
MTILSNTLCKTLGAFGLMTAFGIGAAQAAPQIDSHQQLSTHHVVSGDSLSRIAQDNDLSVGVLAAANNLLPTASIQVGSNLNIPSASVNTRTAVAADSASLQGQVQSSRANARAAVNQLNNGAKALKTYTVRSSDTLRSIARSYGMAYADLASANNIAVNGTLHVGQQLVLP